MLLFKTRFLEVTPKWYYFQNPGEIPVVRYLFLVFGCEVDIQVGNGRLNYINGYIAKDHDTVDVGLGEYVQRGNTAPWLASYRLLSKSTPCIPEVALRMASASEFDRTYSHVLLYPPQPDECRSAEGRERNFSSRMYGIYLQEMRLAKTKIKNQKQITGKVP